MPSKIDKARNTFKFGLDNYLQPLLDEKEAIIKGLKELSKGVSDNEDLFYFPLLQFYEFIEDDFYPTIKSIEKQINTGKLSIREYNNLLEDSLYKDGEDVFLKYIGYLKRPVRNYKANMYFFLSENDKIRSIHTKVFESFAFLESTIFSLKDIVKYGVNKEENGFYYFSWYKDKTIGIYFNENDGEVYKDGIKLGVIKLGTNQFKLFKYLYENIGKPKTYKDIRIEGIGTKKISGEEWQYIHGIKKHLPNKEVKNVVETAGKQQYIIRN